MADPIYEEDSDRTLFAKVPEGDVFDTVVAANTDLLSSDISPATDRDIIQITATTDPGVTIKYTVTKGGTTVSSTLNSGNALNTGSAETFNIPIRADRTYNFQTEAGTTIYDLTVDRIRSITG